MGKLITVQWQWQDLKIRDKIFVSLALAVGYIYICFDQIKVYNIYIYKVWSRFQLVDWWERVKYHYNYIWKWFTKKSSKRLSFWQASAWLSSHAEQQQYNGNACLLLCGACYVRYTICFNSKARYLWFVFEWTILHSEFLDFKKLLPCSCSPY